jgi:hypothetical protein
MQETTSISATAAALMLLLLLLDNHMLTSCPSSIAASLELRALRSVDL